MRSSTPSDENGPASARRAQSRTRAPSAPGVIVGSPTPIRIAASFTVRPVSLPGLPEASPFDGYYGLEVAEASAELVRGRVVVQDHHKQPTGVVHGGVYASIAEALASYGTTLGVIDAGNVGLGMSNHSSFMRPVSGGTIAVRPLDRRAPA